MLVEETSLIYQGKLNKKYLTESNLCIVTINMRWSKMETKLERKQNCKIYACT